MEYGQGQKGRGSSRGRAQLEADPQIQGMLGMGAEVNWSHWCGGCVWGVQNMVGRRGEGAKSAECGSCMPGALGSHLALNEFLKTLNWLSALKNGKILCKVWIYSCS